MSERAQKVLRYLSIGIVGSLVLIFVCLLGYNAAVLRKTADFQVEVDRTTQKILATEATVRDANQSVIQAHQRFTTLRNDLTECRHWSDILRSWKNDYAALAERYRLQGIPKYMSSKTAPDFPSAKSLDELGKKQTWQFPAPGHPGVSVVCETYWSTGRYPSIFCEDSQGYSWTQREAFP